MTNQNYQTIRTANEINYTHNDKFQTNKDVADFIEFVLEELHAQELRGEAIQQFITYDTLNDMSTRQFYSPTIMRELYELFDAKHLKNPEPLCATATMTFTYDLETSNLISYVTVRPSVIDR